MKGIPPELRVMSILQDDSVRKAIAEKAGRADLPNARRLNVHSELLADQLSKTSAKAHAEFFRTRQMSEAIVLLIGRPVLLVKNSTFEDPSLDALAQRLQPFKSKLKKPIEAVGRIELHDHDTFEWVGTGWRIEDDLIVTNRHVALEFAEERRKNFRFRFNSRFKPIRAQIDFREEHLQPAVNELSVTEVVWIAEDSDTAPDMAVLRVDAKAANLPAPIELTVKPVKSRQFIAVVGYPARDDRNDLGAMSDIFKDIFDVKRFAPGEIVSAPGDTWYLLHDASTLGGNSGSVVLDIETQKAVGLHFGGGFRKSNFAVSATTIKSILAQRPWVPVSRADLGLPPIEPELVRKKGDLNGRRGFDAKFLGKPVALPKPGKSHKVAKHDDGGTELKYMHFSVIMNAERRLPIVAAVNIDGAAKQRVKRSNPWGFDPRLPRQAQVGNEFYGPAEFDRGHMVRREDPIWGTEDEALVGHTDSFCFTNACPQVAHLNQVSWLSLEDYILENAVTKGFKACVFTGPVFRPEDREYEGNNMVLKVPIQYWKVAVVVDNDTDELAAAGYMLSQEGMMPEEGFRYGKFKTYQVPIRRIQEEADIRFAAAILKADALSASTLEEKVFRGSRYVEIRESDDIVLKR